MVIEKQLFESYNMLTFSVCHFWTHPILQFNLSITKDQFSPESRFVNFHHGNQKQMAPKIARIASWNLSKSSEVQCQFFWINTTYWAIFILYNLNVDILKYSLNQSSGPWIEKHLNGQFEWGNWARNLKNSEHRKGVTKGELQAAWLTRKKDTNHSFFPWKGNKRYGNKHQLCNIT